MLPDEALKEQLANWFASVDPAMQKVLLDIYKEAPDAVSKAISGGAWEASASDPPLEEVLGGGRAGGFAISNYEVTPWPVTVGTTATVTLGFGSTVAQPAFRTEVKIVDPSGAETNQTLNSDAMEPGDQVTQQFTIQNVVEGYYQIDIDANPDGAPPGQPPNPNGNQFLYPGAGFEVLSPEGGADRQDDQAFQYGASRLSTLTARPDWENALDVMPDAVNYLASIENLAGEESTVLASLGSKVPAYTADTPPEAQNLTALLTAIGVAATQTSSTAGATTAETRAPLLAALTALDGAI